MDGLVIRRCLFNLSWFYYDVERLIVLCLFFYRFVFYRIFLSLLWFFTLITSSEFSDFQYFTDTRLVLASIVSICSSSILFFLLDNCLHCPVSLAYTG